MTKRKTATSGSGQAFSRDGDFQTVRALDSSPKETAAQARPVLDADSHAELRLFLDGECIRHSDGFHAITADKQMWIPFTRTRCPAEALRIAKTEGLVSAKLEAMDEDAREVLLALTLPNGELDN
jgi:hypothetical protein